MWKVSALVTGEFYTKKEHFPGFARPFVFNAEVMLRLVVVNTFYYISNLVKMINVNLLFSTSKELLLLEKNNYRVGRKVEAKDAARGALKSPWWTLGCMYRV